MTTEAELAALRARMATLLIGPACARIAFSLPGLTIRPGGYTVIGMSLGVAHPHASRGAARRPMSVRVNTHLPHNVGAEYDSRTNTIIVPHAGYGANAGECAAIVHEATHAVFDYYRLRARAVVEEAAAYIADAIYARRVGLPREHGGIRGIADEISGHIVAPQRIGGPPNTGVGQEDLNRLIAAIRASSTYAFLRNLPRNYRYPSDGGAI